MARVYISAIRLGLTSKLTHEGLLER